MSTLQTSPTPVFRTAAVALLKATLLVVVLNGCVAIWQYTQLGAIDKSLRFDGGNFYVNGEVIGFPVSGELVLFLLLVAVAVYFYDRSRVEV